MSDAGPDIHFRPASITKTFTAAAIMLLHQRGELNIDDLVTARAPRKGITYLPDSNDYNIPNKNSITIRSLLNHTAGVFDIENNDIPAQAPCPFAGMDYIGDIADQNPSHQFTFDELAGVVAACQIKSSDPWQHEFHYSDTGYSLLGKIIEQVSGMSYSDFILNNLVKPNGLNNTFSPHNAFDTAMPEPAPLALSCLTDRL
jgi:D-alanyl-D-alanine carboxypeptidase